MALPPQFAKGGQSPGMKAAGATPPAGPKEDSPQEALGILAKAPGLDSPRAQAAIKTLRSELDGSSSQRPSETSDSPGMKSASSHMKAGAPPAFARR